MNRVEEIKQELLRLKQHLHVLQKELALIQASCVHQYKDDGLVKTCLKCQKVESLYY